MGKVLSAFSMNTISFAGAEVASEDSVPNAVVSGLLGGVSDSVTGFFGG